MTQNKAWYLQQIDLFKGIPDSEVMKIANRVIEKKCSKNELLYTPFDPSDSICVLKKGEVTLYYSHYGKKLIIDVLKPGSIFGNINFQKVKNDHFAEVTEDAYICFFSVEDFQKIIQARPELMVRFLKIMAEKLAEYEQRLKSGIYDAKEKILHHLELLHEKQKKSLIGKLTGKKITHEKLAAHTGLSRETVTRALNALKKEGRITNDHEGNLIITNNM